jgi:hypothetical protein
VAAVWEVWATWAAWACNEQPGFTPRPHWASLLATSFTQNVHVGRKRLAQHADTRSLVCSGDCYKKQRHLRVPLFLVVNLVSKRIKLIHANDKHVLRNFGVMFFRDDHQHNLPHIHVRYQGSEAVNY